MSKQKVCVVGLGYVGLPLLCAIAKSNKYSALGYDISEKHVEKIKRGDCPITDELCAEELKEVNFEVSDSEEILEDCDIYIICVPTPIYEDYTPNYEPLVGATKTVAKYMKKGSAVIIESTINPGTCDEILIPAIAEVNNLKPGEDFMLAHCPERINPGDSKWTVYNIPRNVGALTKEGCEDIAEFYRSILDASINCVSSIKVAESTKIVENTFRDINIAYVNELAKSFDKMDIDLVETLRGASNKPFAFMAHRPGCGVGGHCIAVDPYYLIKRAAQSGFDHEFLKVARSVNNSMPEYTIELLVENLNSSKMPVNGTRVTVLGLSYKGNVADLRESPALEIVDKLKEMKADLKVFEPYLLEKSDFKSLEEAVENSDAVIICTDHKLFKEANVNKLFGKSSVRVVIDGRNIWTKEKFEDLNILYKGIGQ